EVVVNKDSTGVFDYRFITTSSAILLLDESGRLYLVDVLKNPEPVVLGTAQEILDISNDEPRGYITDDDGIVNLDLVTGETSPARFDVLEATEFGYPYALTMLSEDTTIGVF